MKLKYLFSSLATILLGVLFLVFQGGVFQIMINVFAAILVLLAVIDLITLHWASGIIKAVLGVIVFLFGMKFLYIALYIVGAVLVVYGVMGVFHTLRHKRNLIYLLAGLIAPAICIAVGLFLILGQGTVLSWVFIATGVSLIVSGVLSLAR